MSKAQRFAVAVATEMASDLSLVIGAGRCSRSHAGDLGDAVGFQPTDVAETMAFVPGIVDTGRKGRMRHAGKPPSPSIRNQLFHDGPNLRSGRHLFDLGRVAQG